MALERIFDLFPDKEPTPNKFTVQMGELIRAARMEKGMSQEDLAKKVYRRQATISDLENGKSTVDTLTLGYIAAVLEKPIAYFYPWAFRKELEEGDLSTDDQELLLHFGKIWDQDRRKIAINQVKALADLELNEYEQERFKEFVERVKEKGKTHHAYKRLKKLGYLD